jgi:hypothetical protein
MPDVCKLPDVVGPKPPREVVVEIDCADCGEPFPLDEAGTIRGLCPDCRAGRRTQPARLA